MSDFMTQVTNLIKLHEGLSLRPYVDSTGHWTVGYGHKLLSEPNSTDTISMDQANQYLQEDIDFAISWLSKYDWWSNLTDNRKICLIDMGFNVGEGGFSKFHHMISDLENSDYVGASSEMKNSLWARQVGARAKNDALLMLRG